jgi:hypothetical protein
MKIIMQIPSWNTELNPGIDIPKTDLTKELYPNTRGLISGYTASQAVFVGTRD